MKQMTAEIFKYHSIYEHEMLLNKDSGDRPSVNIHLT